MHSPNRRVSVFFHWLANLTGFSSSTIVVRWVQSATAAPPAVFCIVVQSGDDSTATTFGADGRSERELLDSFAAFVANQRGRTWLHWTMRDAKFGFEAIARRHRFLGGVPGEIPAANRLDLAQVFLDIHGDGYVPHPRLPSLLRANGLDSADILSVDASAAAWRAGNTEALLANTLRRVRSLRELFALEVGGELKTAPLPLYQSFSGAVQLFGPDEEPLVHGHRVPPLTRVQYDVIRALLEAGTRGLTKDKWDVNSRHTDARITAKRLIKAMPVWGNVICFAGKCGRGYRIS